MPQTFSDALASAAQSSNDGLIEPGNIDLFAQPKVKNPDGTTSTVDSHGYDIDGKFVLLPSVTQDGRHLTEDDDIIAEYDKTGRHLGVFDSDDASNAYGEKLHQEYAAGKYDKPDTFETALRLAAKPVRPPVRQATAFNEEGQYQNPEPPKPPQMPVYTRGRFTGLPGHDITSQTPDLGISEGLKQIATAIPALSAKAGRVLTHPEEGVIPTDETFDQMADVLSGAAKVATPVAIGAALVDLPGTVLTLGASWFASTAAQKAAEYAKATPAQQRFFSALAGTAVAIGGASEMVKALDAAAKGTGRAIGETIRSTTEPQPQVIDVRAEPAAPVVPEPVVPPRAGERTLPPAPPEATAAPEPTPAPSAPPQVAPGELAPETPETKLASLQPVQPGNSRAVPFRVDVSPLADQLTQAAQGLKGVEMDVPVGGIVATQPSVDPTIVQNYVKAKAPLTGKLPLAVSWQNQFYVIDGTHRAVADWASGAQTVKMNVVTPDPAKVAELAAPRPPTPPSGVIKEPKRPPVAKPDFATMQRAHAEELSALNTQFDRDGYLEGRSTRNPNQTLTLTPSTRQGVKYK